MANLERMKWLRMLWQKCRRVNSLSTPVGGVGWDNSPAVTGQPDIAVSYEDTTCLRSSGSKRDEIVCTWNGTLVVQNHSPATAFKVSLQLPEAVELTSQAPTVLRCDGTPPIATAVRRSFDARKLFPSKYAKSPLEETTPDVDPNRERYPDELRHLDVLVRCENEAGQQFTFRFVRTDPTKKDLTAEPET